MLTAKLNALVDGVVGPAARRPFAQPGGVALVGDDGIWVLADADPARSLGPALAIARAVAPGDRPEGAPPLHVIVDSGAGALARRASQFALPPTVWLVSGRTMAIAEPAPFPDAPALDPRLAALADEIIAAGADPLVEHGRLIGEVLGLEVVRAEVDDDGARLAVGVGRFDREAHAIVSADIDTAITLRRVVEVVRRHRRAGAPAHPIARLAAARGMRARLVAEPGLVGADHLAPVPTITEAPDLRTPWPAAVAGTALDGSPVVVVCSVGIDLDLVPEAADIRLAAGVDHRLVLAMAERDAHPLTRALAAELRDPATVVIL